MHTGFGFQTTFDLAAEVMTPQLMITQVVNILTGPYASLHDYVSSPGLDVWETTTNGTLNKVGIEARTGISAELTNAWLRNLASEYLITRHR